MAPRLYVGTRKGLFVFEKSSGGGWRAGPPAFLGEPVSAVLIDTRNGDRYAALNLGHFGVKLHRTTAATETWNEVAAPRYPKEESDDGPAMGQVWELTAGGEDEPGVLWAGTIPGGLFRSEDRGENWRLVDALWQRPERAKWMGGGYDHPGIHSICVDPRDSRRLSVAVSCGGVWESADAGASWSQPARGLRAAFLPPELAYNPVMQDPHRMVSCAAAPDHLWIQHHNGIFRSVDGGRNWSEITEVVPSAFGFAAAVHPADPDTAWFVPGIKDEYRVPVDGRLVVNRTRDGGKTFEQLIAGLPATPAWDLVYRHGLDVAGDGETLAFGSTTGNLWLSEDQGDHWQCLSNHLPPINAVCFGPAV